MSESTAVVNEHHQEHYDETGIKFGMWLFLFTEILLFGGLFVLYASYFNKYLAEFTIAGKDLSLLFGTINTVILLISSFSVAASITALRRNSPGKAMAMLSTSLLLGLTFLVNKYFEWGHKFELGIYPNSPTLAEKEQGVQTFYGLYYAITGLHGLHVVIGMILLGICIIMIGKNMIRPEKYMMLENSGLYWHLVDLIWIFVFPLFYLVV